MQEEENKQQEQTEVIGRNRNASNFADNEGPSAQIAPRRPGQGQPQNQSQPSSSGA